MLGGVIVEAPPNATSEEAAQGRHVDDNAENTADVHYWVRFSKEADRHFDQAMESVGKREFRRDRDAEGNEIAGTGHTIGDDEVCDHIRRGNIRLLGRSEE